MVKRRERVAERGSQVHDRHEKTVKELLPVHFFLDGWHQLPLAGGRPRATYAVHHTKS